MVMVTLMKTWHWETAKMMISDGFTDEEIADDKDNDGDGRTDEDLAVTYYPFYPWPFGKGLKDGG